MKNIIRRQDQNIISENFTGYSSMLKNFLIMFLMASLWGFNPISAMSAVPEVVKDIRSGPLGTVFDTSRLQIGSELYFAASDGSNGFELWRSDGTEAGTYMVKNINPGIYGAYPNSFAEYEGLLYFAANDGTNGIELWRSDGTETGTFMVKNIASGSTNSSPASLTVSNNILFFSADDSDFGRELWKSDGTASGTVRVRDIYPGGSDSNPTELTDVDGTLYFSATTGSSIYRVWYSRGTAATTYLVSGPTATAPAYLTDVNGSLFFSATDTGGDRELWKIADYFYDVVMNINPADSSNPTDLVNVNGSLFFTADDGSHGIELWASFGDGADTLLVYDINPSGSSSPYHLTAINHVLFFQANAPANGGIELWMSEGPEEGVERVKDINPTGDSDLDHLTAIGYTAFFGAYDPTNGYELWQSNGNESGTFVHDINPGSADSYPNTLINVNGTLFFSADNGVNGTELMKIEGTSPVISSIADQTARLDTTIGPISFIISDPDTPIANITVTATSSNQSILSDANIELVTVNDGEYTITFTPFADQIGTTAVTITTSYGSEMSTQIFRVEWNTGISIGIEAGKVFYSTIQNAVDNADPGDVILLAPGTYSGINNRNIYFDGRPITIKSEMGAEQTILDLQQSGTGFIFEYGETSSSVVDGLTIKNGESDNGGAITISNGSPTIKNCIIINNQSTAEGGGIYSAGTSNPHIENTIFLDNVSGGDGGGAYFTGGHPNIQECTFTGNTSFGNGGGIGSTGYLDVSRSSFINNTCAFNGGGINQSSQYTIINSIFIGNSAGIEFWTVGSGGGLYIAATPGLLSHLSMFNNTASTTGGGLFINAGTSYITNSIIWGNRSGATDGDQVSVEGTLYIYSSDLEGGIDPISGAGSVIDMSTNIDIDPRFALSESLRLLPDSPCIDAGTNTPLGDLPATDFSGNARLVDGDNDGTLVADMGAYEFTDTPTAAISPARISFTVMEGEGVPEVQTLSITNIGSGSLDWELAVNPGNENWLRAEPVDGSSSGDPQTISLYVNSIELTLMTPGSYFSFLNILDAADSTVVLHSIPVTLTINKTIRVNTNAALGDFTTIQAGINAAQDGDVVLVASGTYYEYDINFGAKAITVKSESGPDSTIVDCDIDSNGTGDGRGFIFGDTKGKPSVLEGFTITNGTDLSYGGGIYVPVLSTAIIVNCRLLSNSSDAYGGGIYAATQNTIIRNCEFSDNYAAYGGAIYLVGSDNIIENCTFFANTASYGGGVYFGGTDNLLNRCSFTANTANYYGGGVDIAGSRNRIYNSIFNGNTALYYGGGIRNSGSHSNTKVVNSIFHANNATHATLGRGGGVYQSAPDTAFINCTFYNNLNGESVDSKGMYIYNSTSNLGLTITNTLFWQDIGGTIYDPGSRATLSYTAMPDILLLLNGNVKINEQPFVDPGNADPAVGFRLDPLDPQSSYLIDGGTDITWLFSDYRGSYRAIDGDKDGQAAFDIGAMEYSEYYGGINGDLPTKAFSNIRIDSSIIAINYGYTIEWDNREPFPIGDRRIYQADEYTVNLALVNNRGMRHELGTITRQVSQLGYEVPYTFTQEHIGEWQLRVEMASDPNQFELSAPITIQYKDLNRYYYGAHIIPPDGADPDIKPDFNDDTVVFWSAETNRLYAIGGPKTLVITWYEDSERTKPIPVVANVTYPLNPKIYVGESMGVPLLPEGTPFETVEMKFSNNDATVSANEFSATGQGWTVLLFRDNEGETADEKEVFEVIRTLPWNHKDSIYSFDPVYPLEETLAIGTEAANIGHDDSCGDGYVFFEDAFYDGFGINKSYDRTTRQGPVFAINRDITGLIVDENNDELDDLVVVWYSKSTSTGVCWPYLPVRYDPQWPALTGGDVIYLDAKLSDDHDQGSGPLDPTVYGLLENMIIYNQPDRSLPGFNPNEEHAAFFTAPESTDPGLFPLRNDINRTDISVPKTYTSDPYVLLKFINPHTGIWDMKVFQVEATDGVDPDPFTYSNIAGNEINAPFPLNQMVYGPCAESSTTTPLYVLKDKDNKMFSFKGEQTTAGVKYFYKLQPGFYYDLNNDFIQDEPDGTCIAWLDGYGISPVVGDPVEAKYVVDWPDSVPTLHLGETLVTAKTQPGESVGLPEIGAQCRVDILYQAYPGEMVKLLDPLRELGVDYGLANPEAELPQLLKPEYDLGTGRWVFTALPYHIQTRLTYDPVAGTDTVKGMLKFRGTYESGVGEPTLLMNVLSAREIAAIEAVVGVDPFGAGQLTALNSDAKNYNSAFALTLKDADIKALSAGDAQRTGYVTLGFNDDVDCPAPTMLSVIRVDYPLYTGELKVIESENPFEEKVTLRHNGDFGGNSDSLEFEWKMMNADFSGIPCKPDAVDTTDCEDRTWLTYQPFSKPDVQDPNLGFNVGAVDTVIQGTGQQLLGDKWFTIHYKNTPDDPPLGYQVSEWTSPQLYEGWIKRVMKKINLFDQKVTDYHTSEANSMVSMISQAGQPYYGDIALSDNPVYLQQLGIIEVYETLLKRGNSLAEGENDTSLNLARLFAANRLADLYMLLGNEAYADASDPTIGFSTESGQYGAEAASIFTFQNQLDSLLGEELVLLRGRDATGVPPFYNRLIWNFTLGDGEVAYKENYNITDQITEDSNNDTYADTTDGVINEFDARILYPQGHGDAWGHYLSASKKYYDLLKSDNFTWQPLAENILVAGVPIGVDYMDERKFMTVAAARARTGAEIINLTYRLSYTDDPEGQWQGYKDVDPTRAWGVDGWAKRAGQAAYFDWAVGNAMLPSEYMTEEQVASSGQTLFTFENISYTPGGNDLEVKVNGQLVGAGAYEETGSGAVTFNTPGLLEGDVARFRVIPDLGIEKVDRTTVAEFWEIAGSYKDIQSEVDQADIGLNPLGLSKNAIPFDIDPGLVASGQTHFEQIYSRAVQAMNNSIAVFNHANEATQLLRRQQDSLADFQRNIENMEADYNKRLIEVYGYPYGDDCGSSKTYDTSYCQTGPDLFHYMYVDASELMGEKAPLVHEFDVTMQGEYEVSSDGTLTSTEKQVTFHVATDSRYGIIKPDEWLIPRKAPGEIQFARSDLLQLRGRFEKALDDYRDLLEEIESQADLITAQYGVNREEIAILNRVKNEKTDINRKIYDNQEAMAGFQRNAARINRIANAVAEAIPKVAGVIVGMSVGTTGDWLAAGRSAILYGAAELADLSIQNAEDKGQVILSFQQEKEILAEETTIELTTLRSGFAIEQQLKQLESMFRSENSLRHELYVQAEGLQQSGSRYLAVLAKGEQLMQDRLRFRKQTAAQIVDYRYKDMSFRIFRNDALEKYRAQFDMAGMYVYLAAKAYDYETTLLDYNSMAGQSFMTDIVKQRTIGLVQDGQPLTGTGLADPMKRMWQNFQVLKPQLGFNNPQIETNRFSLRQELFRIKMDTGSNETWRNALWSYYEEDLWNIPEFRRYCRPFASEGIPQPGLVIPFTTTVTPGLNFFKWPLGGGDSYYSSTNFATKISSVGVWFTNYNTVGLAQTPRIYLIPVGEDILRTPSSTFKDIRTWQIVDQKLPQPFPIDTTELENNPDWIPTVNTVFDQMFELRKHSDFRAYHDSGYLNQSELQYDSRLIGRSVWNSKWLLIIPGQSLLYDPAEGLETFIDGPEIYGTEDRTGNGIFDIKLFFETYGYSGN